MSRPAGDYPLLEPDQGPTLDGRGQDEPAQKIAEVGGDAAEQQVNLVGPEPMTGKPGLVGDGFAFLDPPLGRPAQTKILSFVSLPSRPLELLRGLVAVLSNPHTARLPRRK